MSGPRPLLSRLLAPLLVVLVAACGDTGDLLEPEDGFDVPEASFAVNTGADVLILGSSVSGGANSDEAQAVALLGLTFDIASPTEWAGLTASDFAAYKALVIGDPNCQVSTAAISAAQGNAGTWGPVVNGNVIVIGTDPALHNRQAVTRKGIEFAVDAAGRTGAYITTSCYYHFASPGTAVPVLDGLSDLGNFTARGQLGCFNDAYKTASHPALDGITSAVLSNWGCSVHNGFDSWPADFEVLAIGRNVGAYYTAPDGTKGIPYILARGEGLVVISDIELTPLSSSGEVGTSHTVTAAITADGSPDVGRTVTFSVDDGPHAGTTGTGVTDASGQATFSYVGTATGVDGIRASFTDDIGVVQTSTRVTMEWTEVLNAPPTADAGADRSVTRTAPGDAAVSLDGTGSHDPDGSLVDYAWLSDTGIAASGAAPTVSLGLGSHTFTLTVTDDQGATDSDQVVVTVLNAAPTADAGADQTLECTDCAAGGTEVSLDGTASGDVDGSVVSWEWTLGGSALASGASPAVVLTKGTHEVTLVVTDDEGATAHDVVVIVVEDTVAPEISFDLTTTTLWAPNHKMVTVATGITVADACDAGVTPDALGFTVSSNEPIDGPGDGSTDPDWMLVQADDGTWSLQLRAERSGNGDGRIYTIEVTSSDADGNVSTVTGEVTVPHSQGGGKGKKP